jgi:hypothetical protein
MNTTAKKDTVQLPLSLSKSFTLFKKHFFPSKIFSTFVRFLEDNGTKKQTGRISPVDYRHRRFNNIKYPVYNCLLQNEGIYGREPVQS